MSDRLQFFREQMAAFEGTSDPQKAIEKGYFIQQPRNSLANTIANRIALRPSSSHLLIGGIGSGKTTQLMMARDRINEIGDTHAVYVDASLYTDISEIKPGALIAILGLVLSDLTKSINDESIRNAEKFIQEQSFGREEYISIAALGKIDFTPGILDNNLKSGNKFSNNKWLESINTLYEAVKSKGKQSIIIIIDGLDRLNDTLLFSNLIDNDVQLITESGVGIILVGSLSIAYSQYRASITEQFNYCYKQRCFDVSQDEEALDFFCEILNVRLKQIYFINSEAKYDLIIYSGGVLRDLINLTQAAIEEAYVSDSAQVEQKHVKEAIDSFGKKKLLGTTEEEFKVLRTTCQEDNFIPRSQEDIQLLASQCILEYQYPKKRYAVHPVIKVLLQPTNV